MASIPDSLQKRGQEVTQHAQPSQLADVPPIDAFHLNLYCFLSVAQLNKVDFMPITWEPARHILGLGASGHVNQSLIDIKTSLAFKRPVTSNHSQGVGQEFFRSWMLE